MDHAASHAGGSALRQVCRREHVLAQEAPVSAIEFRGAMAKFTTAVSVIATDGAAGQAGLTCSAVCAISDTPATLAVCVHAKSTANSVIKANGVLSVNCLHADQMHLSQAFAGIGKIPMIERFAMANWGVLVTGAPYCKDALVALDCEIADVRDIATHSIFVVKVMATVESENRQPLIYQQRNYATTRSL
jgi:flavin reductase (NADH)/flavin reductase/chlorophenol-4-monooxygenase component 1